jgi:hypothetical protein
MQETVDVTGLDKAELLCELWQRGMKGRQQRAPTKADARVHLEQTKGNVDHFFGKLIRMDLSPNSTHVDNWPYDLNTGVNACEAVVDRIRASRAYLGIAAASEQSSPLITATEKIGPFTVRTFATASDLLQYLTAGQLQHEQE